MPISVTDSKRSSIQSYTSILHPPQIYVYCDDKDGTDDECNDDDDDDDGNNVSSI